MADLTALSDVAHFWGSDVILSASGDLGRAQRAERSKQRVLRRLLTNPGDYVFHPDYGAGLPAKVGGLINVAEVKALIRAQMRQEASVAQSPAPQIVVDGIDAGVSVAISYVALPDRQPVALAFDLSS